MERKTENKLTTNERLTRIIKSGFNMKGVKEVKELSEETVCFSGKIKLNDKPIGHSENRGHGGCHMTHLSSDNEGAKAFEQFIKDNAEDFKRTVDFGGDRDPLVLDFDEEAFINDLVEIESLRREMKAALRRKVMFSVEGEDGIREYKGKAPPKRETATWQKYREAVAQKYGEKGRLLVDMPEDEALALYISLIRFE